MTIANQYATCLPEAAEPRAVPFDTPSGSGYAYLRAHEMLLDRPGVPAVLWTPEPLLTKGGPNQCGSKECHKTIVVVRSCWDHRITSDSSRPGAFTIGEDWFSTARHADGTPCGMQHGITGGSPGNWEYGDVPRYAVFARPRCGECGGFETVKTVQEAYGDRSTCEACGNATYYSIGD